ncbi:hypothetical protein [Dechloromonas sp.]|uniref:pilus assembly PilX family protein n=1 Tax=Dechloromonas sp. TaxID=1917218 RepID=UPI00216CD1B0|nr:hypothetical protein [Dechloromonas sp.]MBU3695664.1 hypothetical protein [Dechloromonas sp.]
MTVPSHMTLQSGPGKQGGVVLLIALIVLIAMSLIGISMIRQGSSAQLIVGNLAFKEGSNAEADFGVESARRWLVSNSNALYNSSAGYVANGLATTQAFDPYSYNAWQATAEAGVEYVIHRLCASTGSVTTTPTSENQCIVARETSSKEGTSYGNNSTPELFPYYRITVRVTGPRNVRSYIQALMY